MSDRQWQQGNLVELEITDLSSDGDGIGRFDGRVVFVPDTVTGDRALVRLVHLKPKYARGKLHQLIDASSHRIRPQCIVADKCGGCQWQHIDRHYQLIAKQNRILENLQRIGGFIKPPVAPILHTPNALNYRNKSTYPLALSDTGKVQAGYYRKGSHQLVNLNQCPVQDVRLNPLLKEIKADIQARNWSIYHEKIDRGDLRHLSLRIGRYTGEMLLTLVTTNWHLDGIEEQAQIWLHRYAKLVGITLNLNSKRTNVIFGSETRTIAGKAVLEEIFAGLKLQLSADTFFQINTEAAAALLELIVSKLDLQGNETIIDAYCGIGTFTLPLAQKVRQAIGIELQTSSIEQALINAEINHISNVTFYAGEVEKVLPQLNLTPDLVLLDPPRKGCDRTVIDTLVKMKPNRIVYVSCQPATLARDLQLICQLADYRLDLVQPADFFPQTTHVECVAFLSSN